MRFLWRSLCFRLKSIYSFEVLQVFLVDTFLFTFSEVIIKGFVLENRGFRRFTAMAKWRSMIFRDIY